MIIFVGILIFNTPIVKWLDYMFYNCHSLEYLDIISFNTENTYLYENAIAPFSVIAPEAYKKFDAHIRVLGGGIAGHSDAIKL